MPCLSLVASSPSLCGVTIFPTAPEQRSPIFGWWGFPGNSLACTVPVSPSRSWLRRFGMGFENLHFNKLRSWFWCRWHGPHLGTLWFGELSGIDCHVSILSIYLQEGTSNRLRDFSGGAHCLEPTASCLESDIRSALKSDFTSAFCWASPDTFSNYLPISWWTLTLQLGDKQMV